MHDVDWKNILAAVTILLHSTIRHALQLRELG
jgi:hypothetical protein